MKRVSGVRNNNWYLLLFCIFCIQLLTTSSNAQFNIKTGYSLSYNSPDVSSQLFSDFNTTNDDWLDNKFKDFRWMHGLHLGGRYLIAETVGIELGWITKFDKTDAEGITLNVEDFYRKYFYSLNQLHFALESIVTDHFGIGASINYDILSIKARYEDKGSKSRILRDNNYSSNFFITYYTDSSNGVRFALRPYVRVPWTSLNYRDLSNDLNETSGTEALPDKTLHFGISLLFFNGN